MRIDQLRIGTFRNLSDLVVDLDETSLVTVLIGRNGTGKSNLLEAIVLIFRDLDLGVPPAFSYRMTYFCRGHKVEVNADITRDSEQVRIMVDGQRLAYSRFAQQTGREYLPSYVFGYYSGSNDRLAAHFERHQARYYEAIIKADADSERLPMRPLFHARLIHSQFVLLAFFVDQASEVDRFLRQFLRIEELESVLLVLRRPPWFKKAAAGDRFWGATGVVRSFLDQVYDLALAPLRLGVGTTHERLYLFIRDLASLQALFARYQNQRDFFKVMESAYISDLVAEARLRVRLEGVEGSVTFTELSEGEQQLLTVLGLLRFTRDEEALFLLDEPDTHLNPAWTLQYLSLIRSVVGEDKSSQVILTSHDPLMIGELLRSQVRVLDRDPESGRILAREPEEDPRGMGFAGLLMSDIFGLRSTLDLVTLEKLERSRELAGRSELSAQEREELEQLTGDLGKVDFTTSVRDPLYSLFVKALENSPEYAGLKQSPVLDTDERRRQAELTERILRELQDEGSDT